MSAISKTRAIGPPGQTIAKPCPRRTDAAARVHEQREPGGVHEDDARRGPRRAVADMSASASLRADDHSRRRRDVELALDGRARSYPSLRLRFTASGVTAVVSLQICMSSRVGTVEFVQLSDYQHRSRATAVYPDAGDNLTYPALGLCGEAGECAEKVKKAIRDDGGVLSDERRAALAGRARRRALVRGPAGHGGGARPRRDRRGQPREAAVAPRPRRAPGQRRRALAVRVEQRLLPLEREEEQVDHAEGVAVRPERRG